MNILGEGFPEEIIKQVETRQKMYGSGFTENRTPEQIIYLNSNTSWCKLVSSVNIKDINNINNISIQDLYENGDQIARDFILFNGTRALDLDQKSGLDYNQNSWESKAYTNWGIPSADFGFRPMAGIQSVVVKHKNRGSIRAATVNIKAWDKISFEIIDLLYLRLGFSMLLEWGHSIYYDNKGELKVNEDNSLAEDFLAGDITYLEFLEIIKTQRLDSNGNYDAMFARVSNIHWSFQPDGSYDIVLDLISVGDVVESFKVKGNVSSLENSSNQNDKTEIEKWKENQVYYKLKKYASTNDIIDYLNKAVGLFYLGAKKNYLYNISYKTDFSKKYWEAGGDFENATQNVNKNTFAGEDASSYANKDFCLVEPNTNNGADNFYFIRLGNLLKFIEEGVMYKIEDNENNKSILLFDTSVNDNLMHVPPQMMSYDPSICMVRKKVKFPNPTSNVDTIPEQEYFNTSGEDKTVDGGEGFTLTFTKNTDFADLFMVEDLLEVGKIMNIYINIDFIINKINELTNTDTNELKLIDFLKSILSGINSSFCGYTQLDLFIDETTNTVKIIDKNPLPSSEEALLYINKVNPNQPVPIDTAQFELYGYGLKGASFIKEFNFTTELTPDFSTMITVSATSQGNVVGENNTALSRLNKGLEDKYKKVINGGGEKLKSNSEDEKQKLRDIYLTAIREYYSHTIDLKNFIDKLYTANWVLEEIKDYKSAATTYFKLYKKYIKTANDYFSFDPNNPTKSKDEPQFQPGTGFIPFNLSLKMDGLSGMKIGSKFEIDTRYLPSNYPTSVDFLIRNMVHEIKNNKWTTTLESYCIAKSPKKYESKQDSTSTSTTSSPSPSSSTQLYKGQNKSNYLDTVQFLTWVLNGIGIPNPNQSQIQFMKVWRQAEGGKAAWNPFNTTLKKPNSKPYNKNVDPNTGKDYPVQNYANRSDGLNATVSSLKSQYYIKVVSGIKNIKSDSDINNVMKLVNESPWGTKFVLDYNKYVPLTNFLYTDPIISK